MAAGQEDDDEEDAITGGTASAWGFGPATPRPVVILLLAGDAVTAKSTGRIGDVK